MISVIVAAEMKAFEQLALSYKGVIFSVQDGSSV